MDSLDDALGKLLSDPGAMARVMSLAQSLGAALPQEDGGAALPPQSAAPLPAVRTGDRQTELFRALGSFLPDKRREKLMKALQIAQLSRLARSALAQSDREE